MTGPDGMHSRSGPADRSGAAWPGGLPHVCSRRSHVGTAVSLPFIGRFPIRRPFASQKSKPTRIDVAAAFRAAVLYLFDH